MQIRRKTAIAVLVGTSMIFLASLWKGTGAGGAKSPHGSGIL